MSATFVLIIRSAKKALKQMLFIYYLILLNGFKVQVLWNLDNKVIIINLVFADKLGFSTQKINVGAQKIDNLTLKIFEIVIIYYLL